MQAMIGLILLAGVFLLSPVADCQQGPCAADDKEPWSYHGRFNGPANWGNSYPLCYGQNQSPVEINVGDVKYDPNLPKLVMNKYDSPITKAKIENNGHTVVLTPQDGENRTIKVDDTIYFFEQLHFHWGRPLSKGSEHTIDLIPFSMEAHLVHRSQNNKIAVVAVLFQVVLRDNTALKPIADALRDIPYKNDVVQLPPKPFLILNNLVPNNPSSFFLYSGSLTTPACNEGVMWSVLKGVRPVGRTQLLNFRRLYSTVREESSSDCIIIDNIRPIQPLNGRVIYSSK